MNVLLSHFSNLLISVPKKWCLQNFCSIKKWMMLIIVDKSIFKIITWLNNLVLITGFNTRIFCCVHFIWFMNYIFSTKMWFVKTLSWIVKFKSQVVKWNPALFATYLSFLRLFMESCQSFSVNSMSQRIIWSVESFGVFRVFRKWLIWSVLSFWKGFWKRVP